MQLPGIQGTAERIADVGPIDPVPGALPGKVILHGPRGDFLVPSFDERSADLCDGRVCAEEIYRKYFERPEHALTADKRDDGDAFALIIAHNVEKRLFLNAWIAIQKMLAPSDMPLVQRKWQLVRRNAAQAIVVSAQRRDARDSPDRFDDHGRIWPQPCRV
jgi:hypothetical protein